MEGDARREAPAHVDWWRPSPDGHFLAYGISEGGGAQGGIQLSLVRVVDLRTATQSPRPIYHVVSDALAWLPNSRAFTMSLA